MFAGDRRKKEEAKKREEDGIAKSIEQEKADSSLSPPPSLYLSLSLPFFIRAFTHDLMSYSLPPSLYLTPSQSLFLSLSPVIYTVFIYTFIRMRHARTHTQAHLSSCVFHDLNHSHVILIKYTQALKEEAEAAAAEAVCMYVLVCVCVCVPPPSLPPS